MIKELGISYAPHTDGRATGEIILPLTPMEYWELHKDALRKKLQTDGFSKLSEQEKDAVMVGRSREHHEEELKEQRELARRRRLRSGV